MHPKLVELAVAVSRYHFKKPKQENNMNGTTIIISKGTLVCPSELGHNNFYYPVLNECVTLTEDIEVEELPWIGGGNLCAYKIIGQKNIVWIEKKHV